MLNNVINLYHDTKTSYEKNMLKTDIWKSFVSLAYHFKSIVTIFFTK